MPPKILLIEEDAPEVRLLAWGLVQQGGYDVHVGPLGGGPEQAGALRPDFIVINTNMPVPDKRRWIETFRYLVPAVKVIDLYTDGALDADTGADAYLAPPYIDSLVAILHDLSDTPATGADAQ